MRMSCLPFLSLFFSFHFSIIYSGAAAADDDDVDFTAIYDFIYPNLIIEETY